MATGILATFCGTPVWTPQSILGAVDLGVRSFRVTSSYRSDQDNRALVDMLRESGRSVDVYFDVGRGTKLRVRNFAKSALERGDRVTVGHADNCDLRLERPMGVALAAGTVLYLGDSDAMLRVTGEHDGVHECQVVDGGPTKLGKAITAAGVDLGLGAVNHENLGDFATANELAVEYVMLSFVRSAAEIERCRQLLEPGVRIAVKIETREALTNLRSIVDAADTVLVARGDLALQCGYENLGLLQWEIAAAAMAAHKPFVVATQVFESILSQTVPNRADLLDLASAAALGADLVMFGPETCQNPRHIEALETAQRVLTAVAKSGVRMHVSG